MSYDISFKVKVEGVDQYVCVGDCSANITWNVRKIIELSTGLPWHNEANNGLCKYIMPSIKRGLAELRNNPHKYKPYEAKNGWGTVEGTRRFFDDILCAWHELLINHPELEDVATFWIE